MWGLIVLYENSGSNALKEYGYAIPEWEAPEQKSSARRPKKGAEASQASKKAQKRALTAQMKFAVCLVTAAVFAMAFTVLMFKATLNTEYKTLSERKAQLSDLTSQVEQLSSEIEGRNVISAVDEKATEMGLHQADKEQIVYITLDSGDSGEVLAEDGSNRGLRLFFNKIAAIAEYLY